MVLFLFIPNLLMQFLPFLTLGLSGTIINYFTCFRFLVFFSSSILLFVLLFLHQSFLDTGSVELFEVTEGIFNYFTTLGWALWFWLFLLGYILISFRIVNFIYLINADAEDRIFWILFGCDVLFVILVIVCIFFS